MRFVTNRLCFFTQGDQDLQSNKGKFSMCELLGLSSNRKTTINLSLTVLAKRGENPNLNGDGWGIAFHEGKDVRLIKDTGQAKNSEWVEFIKKQQIRSHDIIAHIRKSTIGRVSYSNTHPFTRELNGRVHSFAHNGTLKNVKALNPIHYHPIGETDSELSFCLLMDRMEKLWRTEEVPPLKERVDVVEEFAHEICRMGPSNFLYSDGEAFFAHGDVRHDPLKGTVSWPGLHYYELECSLDTKNFDESARDGISIEGVDDVVTLFASVPLNDCPWVPLKRGELIAVSRGKIVARRSNPELVNFLDDHVSHSPES